MKNFACEELKAKRAEIEKDIFNSKRSDWDEE